MNENEIRDATTGERRYSARISGGRRALFASPDVDMDIEPLPLVLSSEHIEYQDISKITSTAFVGELLETPERNMGPRNKDISPTRSATNKGYLSSLSLAELSKTPKDSNTQIEEAPKLSRKSIGQVSDKDDPTLSSNKTSKVRTSLFPDTSLSTKQFYSPTESKVLKKTVGLSKSRKLNGIKIKRIHKKNKRQVGQINIGVRHKIRKKVYKPIKISNALVAKIKTYKSDLAANSGFEEYMKDLDEISKSREVKLIQHLPNKSENKSLKRPCNGDTTEEAACKKFISTDGGNSESEAKHEESHRKRHHNDNSDMETAQKKMRSNEQYRSATDSTSDETFGSDSVEDEVHVPIENILHTLEDSIDTDKENKFRDKEEISEISNIMMWQLKLNRPSEPDNLNEVSPVIWSSVPGLFQDMATQTPSTSNTPSNSNQSQYYPLFYPQKTNNNEKSVKKESPIKRKKLKISSDQMLLDAGQKKFGLVQCNECNFVYHAGDPKDEDLHYSNHNAENVLAFNGWKNERIIEENNGRVIQILPGDSRQWLEKVKRLTSYINREMGYDEMENDISKSMVFLYIFNKSIKGCLIAEHKSSAYKLLTVPGEVDFCSTEEFPVLCGVTRLWISKLYRRKGVGTKLMESLRKHFLPDRMLEKHEIALSAPTPDGKLFGTKYFETPNFYTYMD